MLSNRQAISDAESLPMLTLKARVTQATLTAMLAGASLSPFPIISWLLNPHAPFDILTPCATIVPYPNRFT